MKQSTICIVEDDHVTGLELQLMLQDLGYEAAPPVSRGEEALLRLKHTSCDLMLMDIQLAGKLNGIETAKRIVQRFGIPIIFLTAHEEPQYLQAAKATQPHAFLLKPCTVSELQAAVELALMRNEIVNAKDTANKVWENTFDAVPDLTFIVDNNFIIQRANRAMAERLGVAQHAIVGKYCYEVMHNTKKPHEDCPHLSASVQTHECHIERWEDTLGGYFITTISPIFDENGQSIGWVHVCRDITERRRIEQERERLVTKLENALAQVKTLSGLLPICSGCKNIRDDQGYWKQIEEYIAHHTEASFSHSICPDCVQRLYPDIDATIEDD